MTKLSGITRAVMEESKTWILPTGKFLGWRTEVDRRSERGLAAARSVMEQEGLVVLDAHVSMLDIFATGTVLTRQLPVERLVLPIAGYYFYVPVFKEVIQGMDKPEKGFYTMPVFRREEWQGGGWRRVFRKLYLQHLERWHTRWLNDYFLKTALQAVRRPHQLVMLAPYGGPASFGTFIRRGVWQILQTGAPALVTYTQFDWKRLKYRVYAMPYVLRVKPGLEKIDFERELWFGFKLLEGWGKGK